MLKHTIEGTKEETFDEQGESDTVIEDVEVTLNAMRKSCTCTPKTPARWSARLRSSTACDEIDCSRMGSGGYSIPSICEPEIVHFKKSSAQFILHVEKTRSGGVSTRTSSGRAQMHFDPRRGQPPRGVRRLLNRLHHELKLPVFCLLDNDPRGYYIYSVLKQARSIWRTSRPEWRFRIAGTSSAQ